MMHGWLERYLGGTVIEAILALLAIVAGFAAEAFRRKWKHEEQHNIELAHRYAKLLEERDAGWRTSDPGRIFSGMPDSK
jgi:hypothetical protein